jgi:hypothetical protein
MMSASRKWRDVLPIHPAAELFPLMSPEEIKALGADIKKNGLREQITLMTTWSRPENPSHPLIECSNVLIDGRNRLDAMETAGINLFRMDGQLENSYFRPLSDKVIDPYSYAVSLNIHRRHLTAEQKRELIAKLIKATPETSNRQIADQVKVSHPYVAKVRASLEETGDVETVTTSIDTRGRRQQARKKPEKKAKPLKEAMARASVVDRTVTADAKSLSELAVPAVEPARVSPHVEDDREPPAEPTLQDHVGEIADQIMDVGEALGAGDRALFLAALRQELHDIERVWAAEATAGGRLG